MNHLREPLSKEELVENTQSRLTEEMVISRFLWSENSWFTPEQIAVPNSADKDHLQETLSQLNLDCPVGGFNGPDLIGNGEGEMVHVLEAKGGRKLANNGKHDLSDVILRNFHPEKPSESASILPRDEAYRFWQRLTNKNEGYKDKVAESGIKRAIEGIKQTHPHDVEFSVYIVWDDVEKMDFIEFLEKGSEFKNEL